MSKYKKTAEEWLKIENAELKSQMRQLEKKMISASNSTEMAKIQAQLNVLFTQQDRQSKLENEFADRKKKYNDGVAKRIAKDAAKAKAISDIENEVPPTESPVVEQPINEPGSGNGPSVSKD